MGQALEGPRARLTDFLHRQHARTARVLGREIEFCFDHPRILSRKRVQEADVERFANSWATRFYEEPVDVEAPQVAADLCELEDVWVVGEDGLVFFDPDHVLAGCHHVEAKFPKKARRPIRRFAKKIEEPVFILRGRSSENRAHFLIEHLPRLVLAQEFLEPGFKVLVMGGQAAWQLPYLEKLGIPRSSVIDCSNGTLFCRRAYYLSLLSPHNQSVLGPSRTYQRIAESFRGDVALPREKRSLFLSRADARRRALANEGEVIRIFEEFYGSLEVVRLGEHTLDEQVARLAAAELVVGPHGQAFRSVLFAKGARVIQLCSGSRAISERRWAWEEAYSGLSLSCGNRSLNLYSTIPNEGDTDWHFPADLLRRNLHRLRSLEEGGRSC